MIIDTSTQFGQRVERRLKEERIIWMTTVDAKNAPQPRPVWFWWDGETFLIYSQANTHKLNHIASNPNVALHFDGDGKGGDIIVFSGQAYLDETTPPANEMADYAAKYQSGFEQIGMSAEQFAQAFSAPLRVTPTSLRGH